MRVREGRRARGGELLRVRSGAGRGERGRLSWACAGRRGGVRTGRRGRARRRSGRAGTRQRREREKGRREGEKRKRKKRKRGKRNRKREKEIEEKREKKWEGGKRKEGKERARAGGDCGMRRPAGGVRGRVHAREEREEKEREKKRGRDLRRSNATRRAGWEKDGTCFDIGCRVVQEKF